MQRAFVILLLFLCAGLHGYEDFSGDIDDPCYAQALAENLNDFSWVTHEPKSKDGSFLIYRNPHGGYGFFSIFMSILGVFQTYERGNYSGLEIALNKGDYYDPGVGPNWWNYFFEPIFIGDKKGKRIEEIGPATSEAFAWSCLAYMSRETGFELIQKYVQVKPHVLDKVDRFSASHFDGSFVIGVHYRGTDKFLLEAKYVPYESIYNQVEQTIKSLPLRDRKRCKIFVATDEQAFLEGMQKQFPDQVISYDVVRSTNGQPVHYSYYRNNNYQKGEDALMDCLLLSRCQFLIRTTSNLSFCAERFNPYIPVTIVR